MTKTAKILAVAIVVAGMGAVQAQAALLFTDGDLWNSGNWSKTGQGGSVTWGAGDWATYFGGQTTHSGNPTLYLGNNGAASITHTCPDLFQASTTYQFKIDVGTRSDNNGSDIQDRMQIASGSGTVFADSRVADLGYVAQTGWQDVTLSYTTPASGGPVGQSIRIIYQRNHQTSGDWSGYWQTQLDDAQLSTVTQSAGDIPEPATMALLGLAAAGLGGYIRRRRTA